MQSRSLKCNKNCHTHLNYRQNVFSRRELMNRQQKTCPYLKAATSSPSKKTKKNPVFFFSTTQSVLAPALTNRELASLCEAYPRDAKLKNPSLVTLDQEHTSTGVSVFHDLPSVWTSVLTC